MANKLIPFPEANDDEPAGCVCPARKSGWIAWWPGNDEESCRRLTLRAYEHGIEPPKQNMVPVLSDGVWFWESKGN